MQRHGLQRVMSHVMKQTSSLSSSIVSRLEDIAMASVRTKTSSSGSHIADDFNLLPPDVGLIQVDSCLDNGFIVGDVQVEGSIVCVGDVWLRWSPTSWSDVTMESLAILDIVLPIPDILVLGCGKSIQQVPRDLMDALRKRFVAVEAVDTKNAVATFNILNQEGRKVVGAFVPINSM